MKKKHVENSSFPVPSNVNRNRCQGKRFVYLFMKHRNNYISNDYGCLNRIKYDCTSSSCI